MRGRQWRGIILRRSGCVRGRLATIDRLSHQPRVRVRVGRRPQAVPRQAGPVGVCAEVAAAAAADAATVDCAHCTAGSCRVQPPAACSPHAARPAGYHPRHAACDGTEVPGASRAGCTARHGQQQPSRAQPRTQCAALRGAARALQADPAEARPPAAPHAAERRAPRTGPCVARPIDAAEQRTRC
eukprot:scaffold842_cov357-Prasinococcus_capsulatus_cf.AAC.8